MIVFLSMDSLWGRLVCAILSLLVLGGGRHGSQAYQLGAVKLAVSEALRRRLEREADRNDRSMNAELSTGWTSFFARQAH